MNRVIVLTVSIMFFLLNSAIVGKVIEFNTKNNPSFDALLKEGKPVVVKFYQPWCSACKSFEKTFDTASNEFPNASFIAVHCDANKNIAKKYNIHAYPTIIFFDSKGTMVDTKVGSLNANQLQQKVKKLK